MNFNFIYILALFVSITEFVSCFLLQPTLSTTEEWSQWAIVLQNPCLRIRTRICAKITADCNSTREFSICPPVEAHWEEWSPMQCTVENGTKCIITKTRNCSVPTLTKCHSNATGHVRQVWKDMNTCPCREVATNQGTGQWGHWSGWQCKTDEHSCYIFRIRQCSVPDTTNCPPSDKSQIKTYELSACPCINGTDNSNNYLSWSEWEPWECHKEQVSCVIYRYRHCLHGKEGDCEKLGGTSYEMKVCDDSCEARTSLLSVTTAIPDASARSITQVSSFISTVKRTSLTSAKSASVIAPFTKLSVEPTSPTSVVPVYWLDWTGWDCRYTFGSCFMTHTRNCSTFNSDDCNNQLGDNHYEVHTCITEICPAEWLDWGAWRCKMENNGYCNMTRSRDSSTGSTEACGTTFSITKSCERQICPDKFDRQESGLCRGYNYTSCTDPSSCNVITDPTQLICQFDNTATKSCPKACGCCEEEAHWLEWSDCVCHRMQGNTCRMKRSRACSTHNTRDCKGMSRLEAACSDSICPSAHYSYNSTLPVYSATFSTTTLPVHAATFSTTSKPITMSTTAHSSAQWSEWFYGKCSVSCGNGTTSRLRHCNTGRDIDCAGKPFETVHCTATDCPVDGTWSQWSQWSTCTNTCGYGMHTRIRKCDNPTPQHAGLQCRGEHNQTTACEIRDCPHWLTFQNTTSCSVTCGTGFVQQKRYCSTGNQSDCTGSAYTEMPCNLQKCA